MLTLQGEATFQEAAAFHEVADEHFFCNNAIRGSGVGADPDVTVHRQMGDTSRHLGRTFHQTLYRWQAKCRLCDQVRQCRQRQFVLDRRVLQQQVGVTVIIDRNNSNSSSNNVVNITITILERTECLWHFCTVIRLRRSLLLKRQLSGRMKFRLLRLSLANQLRSKRVHCHFAETDMLRKLWDNVKISRCHIRFQTAFLAHFWSVFSIETFNAKCSETKWLNTLLIGFKFSKDFQVQLKIWCKSECLVNRFY